MSDSLFQVSTIDSGVTRVSLVGEVDASVARQLQVSLEQLVGEGHTRLLVDLSAVTFIDSTGLGVFLFTVKRLRRRRGRLAVFCPHPVMRELFELVGHNLIFPVEATFDAALAHLRPRRRLGAPGATSRSPATGHSAGR
jgi:anti-sigma B factor antagonist